MSIYETPMTHRFHRQVGGLLVEEYPLAGGVFDGVIVDPGRRRKIIPRSAPVWERRINLDGCDVLVVESKARRLGRNLFGQAFIARLLIEQEFTPRSVRPVVICAADDPALRPFFDLHQIAVVVDEEANAGLLERRDVRRLKRRLHDGGRP